LRLFQVEKPTHRMSVFYRLHAYLKNENEFHKNK
jgi:hypothetical protein